MPLSLPLSKTHRNLHLYMEFFYINGLIFLHINTGKINFHSVKLLASSGATSVIKALEEKNKQI